jgi:hypothetical protein
MADLIIPTNGSTPQTSVASSYFNSATFTPTGAIRGDTALSTTIQPVLLNGSPIYLPDYQNGDQLFAQLGPIDSPATAGTFTYGVNAATIASVSTSGPYTITTAGAHLIAATNTVRIIGSATTPSIDGTYVVASIGTDALTLSGIPAVTGSGAGGYIFLETTTTQSLIGLAYNVAPATFQTALNSVLIQLDLPDATVSQPTGGVGVYELIGATNGALPTTPFCIDATDLFPFSQGFFSAESLGSSSSPFVGLLVLEQAPFCYSQFTTPLPGNILSITGVSIANPAVVTTSTPHGYTSGQTAFISGTTTSASINGPQVVTVTGANTFSVPANVTGVTSGTGVVALAGVTSTVTQAGGVGTNQVITNAFTVPNTYSGGYVAGLTLPAPVTITGISIAAAAVVTTSGNHLLTTGQTIVISGSNSTPVIDGSRVVTVLSPTTYSVPVTTSGSGTAGTFTLAATCGTISAQMTVGQIGSVLANHPYVNYGNGVSTPNIILTAPNNQIFTCQFTGNLGASAVPVFTLSSIALIAPQGLGGTLNYNTTSLYAYAYSQSGVSFPVPFSFSLIRLSGEKRTIWGPNPYTIFKDNLNYLTMVPVSLPGAMIVNSTTFALITPTAIQFFNANFVTWFNSLPTSLPGSPGLPWNNGQSLSVS